MTLRNYMSDIPNVELIYSLVRTEFIQRISDIPNVKPMYTLIRNLADNITEVYLIFQTFNCSISK